MDKIRLGLLCLLTIIAACGDNSGAPQQTTVSENDAINSIVASSVEAHYRFLADDSLQGRMTGEPGYDTAAKYVAEFFSGLGIEPGGSDAYYQPVTFRTYKLDTDTATLIAHRDGNDQALRYREDFAMPGDKVRAKTSVRADVVYVGFGVHAPDLDYSDYDGVDVEGKIVALFGGAPASFKNTQRAYYSSSRTKTQEAIDRGAVGFISLRSRRADESYPWDRFKKSMGKKPGFTWLGATGDAANYFPESMGSVVLSSEAAREFMSGTPLGFDEARDAAEAGTPASTPLGFEVSIETETKHAELSSSNVIGVVKGTALADEYVVFSAHLDHLGRGVEENGDDLYNGAYDNAMGVALMMETARAFALKPPRRSVMFIALTGEERGLLGSDYFVNYPTVPIDSIVANVNLDMPLFLYPTADLIAFGSEHSSLASTVETAVAAEDFALSPDPVPEESLFIRSDQYSFVRKGIPAIYLIPGYASTDPTIDGKALFEDHIKNHYHRPSDDLSRPVDWPSAERFARANARIGYEIADEAKRPTWNAGDFFGEKFGRPGTTIASSAD